MLRGKKNKISPEILAFLLFLVDLHSASAVIHRRGCLPPQLLALTVANCYAAVAYMQHSFSDDP
jgi:hypothetical protein